jgi:hypothetical protein
MYRRVGAGVKPWSGPPACNGGILPPGAAVWTPPLQAGGPLHNLYRFGAKDSIKPARTVVWLL